MLSRANTLRKLETLKPATIIWAQQTDALRQMWADGVPTEEIAERLGRTVSSVLTQAVRVGLPRRAASGRKPHNAERKAPVKINRNVIAFPAVRSYSGTVAEAQPAAERKTRKCLMCSSSFASFGSHNRICNRCKDTQSYQCGQDHEFSVKIA